MINFFSIEFYHLINRIFVFFIDIFTVLLVFWVYSASSRQRFNRCLFCLWAISILFWVNAGYFLNVSESFEGAMFWARFAPSAVFVFLGAFYLFSVNFPREKKRIDLLDKIIFSIGIFLALFTFFSKSIIKDVEFMEWGPNPLFTSFGKIFFYGTVVFFTSLAVSQIFKGYFDLSSTERLKVQYFLVGLFVFVIMNLVFNVAFPLLRGSIQYWQLGNYSAIFLLGFTAYAIVKRELFGIRVVLTTLLVGIIAILILLDILFLTTEAIAQSFKVVILIIFIYFGFLLVQSVLREIKYRERLQKAYEELKRLDEAKSEFISIASHQLRTPLSSIKGYISMILEGTYEKLPERAREPLENVYQSNERLIKLVNDLLNVSRIESGKIELELKKSSLEDIISSVIEEMKLKAKSKRLYIKWEKPKKSLPKILIDEDKIRQSILNVVDNGIRYTDKGGVNVKLESKNSKHKITVVDTGAGMNKKEMSKIFQTFSRGTAGNRLYTEGAGLGLYIAKKFIELHQGRIWVESKGKGRGSTFFIELPFK